jgi:hypothetical protein
LTRQRRRKRALRPNLTGMDGYNRDGERHNQAADYQGSSSGKLKRSPNLFSTEERFRPQLFTIPAGS